MTPDGQMDVSTKSRILREITELGQTGGRQTVCRAYSFTVLCESLPTLAIQLVIWRILGEKTREAGITNQK